MSRQEGAVRAGLSTVALVIIVLAVPIGLLLVGGLPFWHVDPAQIARALVQRRTFDSGFMIHWVLTGSLVIAWMSWLWMTLCVMVEVKSWITGRSSAQLPASRTMQSVAACLVGTALAFSTAGRVSSMPRPAAGPDVSLVEHNAVSLRVIDDPPSTLELQAGKGSNPSPNSVSSGDWVEQHQRRTVPLRTSSPVANHQTASPSVFQDLVDLEQSEEIAENQGHLVVQRETLWSIASDRLGSGLRWKELARQNYGIRQADGGMLTEDNWIRPGWTLVLPQTIHPIQSAAQVFAANGSRNHQSDRGSVPAPPTDESISTSTLVGSGAPFAADTTRSLVVPNTPFTPIGAGVVGAGVVSLLDRMRRVQQRHRRMGTYIKLPSWPETFIEQRLRVGGGSEITQSVDTALHLFAREWSDSDGDAPTVNGVIVRPDSIEVVTDSSKNVSGSDGCITVDQTGGSVRVDLKGLPSSRGSSNPPAPLLVTAGRGSDGLVLVNLESLGTLLVTGDPEGCEGVVRALALELATSFWSGRFDLVLVGFGAEFERFDRVEAMNDIPAVLDAVCRRRIRAEELLKATGHVSFARGRISDRSHRWDPQVIICGPSVAREDLEELLALTPDPRLGIAIVAIGSGEHRGGSRVLRLSGPDRASSLEVLGSIVSPQHVEGDELTLITDLLGTARSREATLLSEEPYVNLPIRMPAPAAPESAASTEPDGTAPKVEGPAGPGSPDSSTSESHADGLEVEVAVLGQVEIRGQRVSSPEHGQKSSWSIWRCTPTESPMKHGQPLCGPIG